MSQSALLTGGCLCGAVRFELRGARPEVSACHCGQCRRWSGHLVASTVVKHEGFCLTESRGLAWYQSSAEARRGFCRECGSSLFWEGNGMDHVAVMVGALDSPTGMNLTKNIGVSGKGDYYDISDELPQSP